MPAEPHDPDDDAVRRRIRDELRRAGFAIEPDPPAPGPPGLPPELVTDPRETGRAIRSIAIVVLAVLMLAMIGWGLRG